MKSILIIIDYFGQWPEWFPIFLASCKFNPTVQWLIHTDCPIPAEKYDNVRFVDVSFAAYVERVSSKLEINFEPANYYKLCDLRPAYGVIYEDEIRSYDYFGFGDVDVIYGNIREFYNDKVLEKNVISTQGNVAGHLTLIKNEGWLRKAFLQVPNWRTKLLEPLNQRFDEDEFSKLFRPRRLFGLPLPTRYWWNNYFKNQYTTPLIPRLWHNGEMRHPETWFWRDGRIYNALDGDRTFIYLHFMNFIHARYMHPMYGAKAPWEGLPKLLHFDDLQQIEDGVRIDRFGFSPI